MTATNSADIQTIPEALAYALAAGQDNIWAEFAGAAVTYRELGEQVDLDARALYSLGVRRGSRVGLFMGNRPLWLELEYATVSLGAWLVPLNTMLTPSELARLIDHAHLDVLIWVDVVVGHDTTEKLRDVLELTSVATIIGVGDAAWPADVVPWENALDAAAEVDSSEIERIASGVAPDDVALVIYTSGTTGNPKGVLQSHRAVVSAGRRFAERLGLGPADRTIFAAPLYWIHGCWHQAVIPLFAGSALLLEERFEPGRILQRIEESSGTHLQGIPAQFEQLLAHEDSVKRDLTSVRLAQIGGTTFLPTLPDRLKERMPRLELLGAYGMSEAGSATYTPRGASVEDIATTVGPIHPGGEARVVDPEDNAVERELGEVGELLIKVDCVALGYLDDPQATEASRFDGWLRTGDLARIDARGYITIIGRNQDSYKRSGVMIYTVDAETALESHPLVERVAVVGVPAEGVGFVGAAFVVPVQGAKITEEELLQFCDEQLAKYKIPAFVRVLDELPMTASGKVRKFQLRDEFEKESVKS